MKSWLYDDYMAERAEWMPVTRKNSRRITTSIAAGLLSGLFWVLLAAFIAWWRR